MTNTMPPLLLEWLTLCATNEEFVSNYNRLFGASVSFGPTKRTGIEALVDKACGHTPTTSNSVEKAAFVRHCIDLFLCIPGLDD